MSVVLTAASYTEGDAFQAEKRTVFATAWLPVCHGGQLPAAGDYSANTIGGWPVFAVRGADGALRAFRNVCRHQNMQVVEKPAGRCDVLRCRYHGWTYDLAGRFVTAPDPVAPADRASPANHLQPLPTADVHGVVLFTLGPATTPAPEAATPLFARAGAATYAGTATAEIGCNWKTYLELRLAAAGADAPDCLWPLLLAHEDADGVVVEQVVPRTFLRTRVVYHRLAAGAAAPPQRIADTLKAEAEALQAARAAGTMAATAGRVAGFHARLAAALAADPGTAS